MSHTPRRRVIISSDEEDAVPEKTENVFLSDDEKDDSVVEDSHSGSMGDEDGSLHSPIFAGSGESFSSSKDKSGFSTSTPRAKASRRADFKLDDSIREVSLSDSGDDLRPGDRSRSFIDEKESAENTMSPISKKLAERNDSASNQKLRERLLRKAISSKKNPNKERDVLLDVTLSPIPHSAKKNDVSSSVSHMSVDDVSSDVHSRSDDGVSALSPKSLMNASFASEKSCKKALNFDADDIFDNEDSPMSSRSAAPVKTSKSNKNKNDAEISKNVFDESIISVNSFKSAMETSRLPRKSNVIIDSDEEENSGVVEDSDIGDIDESKSNDDLDESVGVIEETNDSIVLDGSSIILDDKDSVDDKNRSESIVCLSSDEEKEKTKEESVQEENSPKISNSKKRIEHLTKYMDLSVDQLMEKKRLVERTMNNISIASMPDGGQKMLQTLKDIDEVMAMKRTSSNASDVTKSPKKEQPKFTVPQQRAPIVIPPKFNPAQYTQLLANDKKRLFGGKMTDDRWQNIQSATERCLKGMHEAMNTRPDENCIIETPKGIKIELMAHQKQGLAWMAWRERQSAPGGILADDMGLGKTLSTISLIMHQKNERLKRKEDGEDQEDKRKRELAKGMGLVPSNATLVVAPASLIYQWEAEIERRVKTDRLHVGVFHGPKNKRESDPKRLARYDIVITTYNLLATELSEKITTKNNQDDVSSDDEDDQQDNWGDQAGVEKTKKPRKKFTNCDSVLVKIAWDRIILDEAHQIKNKTTGASKAACRLAASNRWCLTGTPVHNNLWDMFSLIRFLRVSPFDDESHWKEYIMANSQKCADRLNMLTRSLLLRRTKQQTCSLTNKPLVNLQPKVLKQHDLVLEGIEGQIYDVMFTATQQKVRQMLTEAENDRHDKLYGFHRKKRAQGTEMKNPFNFGPRTINSNDKFQQMSCMLVMLLRLRQACVHMHLTKEAVDMDAFEHLGGSEEDADALLEKTLAEMTLDDDGEKDELVKASEIFERNHLSTKLKKLMEIVDEVSEAGDKIVIVSQWTSLLNIVEDQLKERNARYTSITGAVQPCDRQERVDSFNKENGGARVMLLSLTAGGVGLNLVGGNHLVMVDLHWNPALEAQACDRIYRMGQKKTVYIHRLIAQGTIEQRVLDLQQKKLELAGAVLEGAASKKMNKLTYADLKYLFDLDDKKKDAVKAPTIAPATGHVPPPVNRPAAAYTYSGSHNLPGGQPHPIAPIFNRAPNSYNPN